jgi:adenylate cyclase
MERLCERAKRLTEAGGPRLNGESGEIRDLMRDAARVAALLDAERPRRLALAVSALATSGAQAEPVAMGAEAVARIMARAKPPADWGGFVDPSGSLSRLSYEADKDAERVERAINELSRAKGFLDRLEIARGAAKPYRIRFDAALLSRARREGRGFYLYCVDMAAQGGRLEEILDRLKALEASGDLAAHGSMELTLDIAERSRFALPYYLLAMEGSEEAIARAGFEGFVLKRFLGSSKRDAAKGATEATLAELEAESDAGPEGAESGDASREVPVLELPEETSLVEPIPLAEIEAGPPLAELEAEEAAAGGGPAGRPSPQAMPEPLRAHQVLQPPEELDEGELALLVNSQGIEEFEPYGFERPPLAPPSYRHVEAPEKLSEADASPELAGEDSGGIGPLPELDEAAAGPRPIESRDLALGFAASGRKGAGSGKEAARRDASIKRPIAVKLIGIISIVIVSSLGGMILLATSAFLNDTKAQVESTNVEVVANLSKYVELALNSGLERSAAYLRDAESGQAIPPDESILLVGRRGASAGSKALERRNAAWFDAANLEPGAVDSLYSSLSSQIEAAFKGVTSTRNVSAILRAPACAFVYPAPLSRKAPKGYAAAAGERLVEEPDGVYVEEAGAAVAVMSIEGLFADIASPSSLRQSFVVSEDGIALAHQDASLVLTQADLSSLPIVAELKRSLGAPSSYEYTGPDGKAYLGAIAKTGIAGVGVVITVEAATAFEAVEQIQYRNILIMVMMLSGAFLVVWFFSQSITRPIKALVGAARKIEKGEFRVGLTPKGKDEIGLLTEAFNQMGLGLEEREKFRDTVTKFSNEKIAEMVLKGELKLGGERKEATIFFSDIRSFTAISEKLEPEEVVEFLNAYMTRMVACVTETGGTVDKFIGDAIMATWGAPESFSDHARRAVDTALLMRKSLLEFNVGRGGDKKPVIRIGCGINSGPVVAGQIGSEERNNYTVIGDTVNLASRIEALNKPFGTDILVSQDTHAMIEGLYRFEPMKPIMVKGKEAPQQVYAVIGRLDDPEAPASLKELRALLGIEDRDLSTVDVEHEEVKYKLIDEKKPEGKA